MPIDASASDGFGLIAEPVRAPNGTVAVTRTVEVAIDAAGSAGARSYRYAVPDHLADLFAQVLRPIAEHRGLDSWDKLVAYAAEEWFPSRIAFGKHKGRLIQEARKDAELRRWLDWLAGSSKARSAAMGRW